MLLDSQIERIARVAHEVNRAYCRATGDPGMAGWDTAPDWQRQSYRGGVNAHLSSSMSPAESHQAWMEHKIADGWEYGPIKDAKKKQHPCMVPFDQLPQEQRVKDHLFKAVVESVARAFEVAP